MKNVSLSLHKWDILFIPTKVGIQLSLLLDFVSQHGLSSPTVAVSMAVPNDLYSQESILETAQWIGNPDLEFESACDSRLT
jgi:hypothetical protein